MNDLLDALPGLFATYPLVAQLVERSALVLHGSTTIGMDDHWSDWDFWLLTDVDSANRFDAAQRARFVDFGTPRKGHFQVETIDDLRARVAQCDMQLISELRYAVVITDPHGMATELIAQAKNPMSDAVWLAWFRYHYVEMRSEHRTCLGAMERGNASALLIGVSRAIQHALQAAMVLDREPYRYSKWLAPLAAKLPTGSKVVPLVEEAISLIDRGALRIPGPENAHPLTHVLRLIRTTLIDAAVANGIDEPWLREWWLYIDKARNGIHDVSW
jgi:hypothetical protein